MCVVSMVMDHTEKEWERRLLPQPYPLQPPIIVNPLTQDEVDEFRRLLERAREYDKRNNEPDCELPAKKRKLKKLAKQLGVKISFL